VRGTEGASDHAPATITLKRDDNPRASGFHPEAELEIRYLLRLEWALLPKLMSAIRPLCLNELSYLL
jgi:hypothetical protein